MTLFHTQSSKTQMSAFPVQCLNVCVCVCVCVCVFASVWGQETSAQSSHRKITTTARHVALVKTFDFYSPNIVPSSPG